ncbi:venom peptide isomerase heavy chain-like [Amblyomma americanum]
MVSVVSMFVLTSNLTDNVYCGGTLITSRFVLTAARCVTRNSYHGSKVYVYHESVHLEQKPYIKARDVVVHPNYEWKKRKHNIALLRLEKRITKGPMSHPVCLMDKKITLLNKGVIVVGFGPSHGQKKLRSVEDKILPFTNCSKAIKPLQEDAIAFSNNTVICTAGKGKGTCLADGGGPVLIIEKGRATQIGVISYSLSCNMSISSPSAHVRVDYYFEWIKEVLSYFSKYHRLGKGKQPKKNDTAQSQPNPPPGKQNKPQKLPTPPHNGDIGHLPNFKDPEPPDTE